ncbi:MAG: glycosyltransferase family 1 protein [Clostridiaceae bacterium]
MDCGGVEAVVMNYYRALDKSNLQFDFFVDKTSSFPQRAEIERLGGRVFLVPPYSHVLSYLGALIHLFRKNQYRVVHAHTNTMNAFPLFAAWFAGVPVRVCHNHSTANWGEGLKTLAKYLLRPFARLFATDYFACGEKAGRWMYGSRRFDSSKVRVMPNAIDTKRFAFDPAARPARRRELGIGEDTLVLGHVGRFTFQKNHSFLLEMFSALHEQRPDSVLLLIGEGELEPAIRQKARELFPDGAVRFLGVRQDVNELYSAMDVFCLPSFYEGFPVVLLEAQANGLPCVISDHVSAEAAIHPNVVRVPLAQCAAFWADACRGAACRVADISCAIKQAHDIFCLAGDLAAFYQKRSSAS